MILLFTFPLFYAKILKHEVLFGEDVRKLMTEKIHDKNTDFLFQAILALETPEECYKFFDDLCTVPELLPQNYKTTKILPKYRLMGRGF